MRGSQSARGGKGGPLTKASSNPQTTPGGEEASDGGREVRRALRERGWAGGKARAGSCPTPGHTEGGGGVREERFPRDGVGPEVRRRERSPPGQPPLPSPGPADTHRDAAAVAVAGPSAAPSAPRPARAHLARSRDGPAPAPPLGAAPRCLPGGVVRGAAGPDGSCSPGGGAGGKGPPQAVRGGGRPSVASPAVTGTVPCQAEHS